MAVVNSIQKLFHIDYGNLNEEDRAFVYDKFTEECINRVNAISAIAFLGESVIMTLDFLAGFFQENPMNYWNLAAEILIIVSSLYVNFRCNALVKASCTDTKKRRNLLFLYKATLAVGICLFIMTDILIRRRLIGSYIVFLFVFQVLPFFNATANITLFSIFAVLISTLYLSFVPKASNATLFSSIVILFAFGFSTECFRAFSIKKTISSRQNERMTERFSRLASQTILALSNAVEAKDLYTKGHSQRVAKYTRELARRMGYSEEKLEEIYYIGLLHDIGKIGIRDEVINKAGRLTDEEFAEIKSHPEIGYDILKIITEIPDISVGAKWHHEKVNGSGYPDRLVGDNIPEIARIIAVADAYDAMTSTRSYRAVMAQADVRKELERNSGTQFAPEIAALMLQMIDEDTEYTMHG